MWAIAGRYSALGIELGLAIVIGYYGGRWLDGKFATTPWLTNFGLGFGIVAAFLAIYRAGKQGLRDEKGEK